jgi:hypothetical protein
MAQIAQEGTKSGWHSNCNAVACANGGAANNAVNNNQS